MEPQIDLRNEEAKLFAANYGPTVQLMMKLSKTEARAMTDAFSNEQNKNYKFDQITTKDFDVKSLIDDYKIPVTAYVPKNALPTTPIVVFFHGGGWESCSRATHHLAVAHSSQDTNTIWVSVEYRLSPEFKYPIPNEDCYSVTKWVLDNKEALFGSTKDTKVGVCGDSAGGHLAACVTHRLREKLSFQVLIYPVLDLAMTGESHRKFDSLDYVFNLEELLSASNSYLNSNDDRKSAIISPMYETNFSGIPKTLLINAELDLLIDDAKVYFKKLQDAAVPSEMHVIKGMLHGYFNAYFDCKNAFLESADYLRAFLKNI